MVWVFSTLLPEFCFPLDYGWMAGPLAPMLSEKTNFRYYSKDGSKASQMKPEGLRGSS